MPYKDPTKQREYLRNWRQEQKLRKLTQHTSVSFYQGDQSYLDNPSTRSMSSPNRSPVSLYQPTIGQPHRERFSYQPAQHIHTSAVDQRAVKISPDGSPQTGHAATQAYQIARGHLLTAPRKSLKSGQARRPTALLTEKRSRYVAVPVAAILVEVLSRLF
jgi:hypothetical protein